LNDYDEQYNENEFSKDFYSLYTMEKNIQASFLRNMAVIKNQLADKTKAKDNSEIIEKVLTSLRLHNNDIINIPTGDIAQLYSLGNLNLIENNNNSNTYSENIIKVIKADCFNILCVPDINYIILQETLTNSLLRSYCDNTVEKKLASYLNRVLSFEKINYNLNESLINRCSMILG
jgi:hypothetical protein